MKLMVTGDCGVAGHLALCHVGEVSREERDSVTILSLNMEELSAEDLGQVLRTAIDLNVRPLRHFCESRLVEL